jgi:hypothetical protein
MPGRAGAVPRGVLEVGVGQRIRQQGAVLADAFGQLDQTHALALQAECQPRRVAPVQAQASAQAGYDYASARAVDMYTYRQRWEVAPQGYVPPAPMAYAPPMDGYGAYGPVPYGAPMSYAPPMPYGPQVGMATYANPAYPDGWAYNYQPQGIEIDQGGWYGGVGYNGGAGGGGGGGMTLTMAQPDASNGPSYNNFNNSYGGSYGATNQVNAWQADAFKPKTTTK